MHIFNVTTKMMLSHSVFTDPIFWEVECSSPFTGAEYSTQAIIIARLRLQLGKWNTRWARPPSRTSKCGPLKATDLLDSIEGPHE